VGPERSALYTSGAVSFLKGFCISCSKGTSSCKRMSILQCYNAADCCTLCYFCTDEKNSCAASTILLYTYVPFLKRTCTSKIQNFLLNQFLNLPATYGHLVDQEACVLGAVPSWGYLKSFGVEDNYVATPQCTSHTLGGFKSYSQQLVFSWFTAEQSQIVECVALSMQHTIHV